MNDTISNQRLSVCHPAIITRVNTAANVLAMEGIYFRVIEGARSYAESNADFQLGRTILTKPDGTPQSKITNAPAGYSWHNFNMAVDCAPFISGTGGAIDWNAASPQFQKMVQALTNAGVPQRGGCKGDADHFELMEIPAVPTDADRKAFAVGGLKAVWAQYQLSS